MDAEQRARVVNKEGPQRITVRAFLLSNISGSSSAIDMMTLKSHGGNLTPDAFQRQHHLGRDPGRDRE